MAEKNPQGGFGDLKNIEKLSSSHGFPSLFPFSEGVFYCKTIFTELRPCPKPVISLNVKACTAMRRPASFAVQDLAR